MYCSIRMYRVTDAAELTRKVNEEFLPIVSQVDGFGGYWIVDGGEGNLASITVCNDRAGCEESVARARDWVQSSAPDLIEGAPQVLNGEITAEQRAPAGQGA